MPLAVLGIHPLGFSIVFRPHTHTHTAVTSDTWQCYLLVIFTQWCKTSDVQGSKKKYIYPAEAKEKI